MGEVSAAEGDKLRVRSFVRSVGDRGELFAKHLHNFRTAARNFLRRSYIPFIRRYSVTLTGFSVRCAISRVFTVVITLPDEKILQWNSKWTDTFISFISPIVRVPRISSLLSRPFLCSTRCNDVRGQLTGRTGSALIILLFTNESVDADGSVLSFNKIHGTGCTLL